MKIRASFPSPPPVTVAALRNHFITTYQLREDQAELMLHSSRKSLEVLLSATKEALCADDNRFDGLCRAGHGLKGLFLNMGEPEWAEVARELEENAKAGKDRDYAAVVVSICEGVSAITEYGS